MDNLLIVNRNYFGTATIYETDFYKALTKKFKLYYYGTNHIHDSNNTNLETRIKRNNIDVVFCQQHQIREFLDLNFDNKILLLSDLQKHPLGVSRARDITGVIEKSNLKTVLFRGMYGEYLNLNSDKVHFFPWSLNENTYSFSLKKDNDICFLGCSGVKYPIRNRIKKEIRGFCKEKKYSLLMGKRSGESKINPNFMSKYSDKQIDELMVGMGYVKALQRTKLMLFDSSVYKYPVKKYFECMATGCLILADKPNHSSVLGLVEGEHFVCINRKNWKDRVNYYLLNDEKRERIVRQARQLFLERHTNRVRAKQLLTIIKK